MNRIRLLGRVLDQLEEQIRSARRGQVGGLLLGQPGDSPWIERVLPCRNSADGGMSWTRYEIDPRVVANVARSLVGKPISILGVYQGTDRSEEEEARGLEPVWIEEGPLWLLARANGSGLHVPRVLRRDGGLAGAEVSVEVVRPVERSPMVCPE